MLTAETPRATQPPHTDDRGGPHRRGCTGRTGTGRRAAGARARRRCACDAGR